MRKRDTAELGRCYHARPEATINAVKFKRSTDALDERDAIIIELGREAIGSRRVSPSTFSRALRRFGSKQLVEIVDLMGEYAAVAVLLDAFDQQLPEGQTALLPLR